MMSVKWLLALAVLDGMLLWVVLACFRIVPFPPAYVLLPIVAMKVYFMVEMIDRSIGRSKQT